MTLGGLALWVGMVAFAIFTVRSMLPEFREVCREEIRSRIDAELPPRRTMDSKTRERSTMTTQAAERIVIDEEVTTEDFRARAAELLERAIVDGLRVGIFTPKGRRVAVLVPSDWTHFADGPEAAEGGAAD
jgi:antitoxin (DNA-binding transcriptional repressor) of toxin-antitoxin stability system